uniref:Putative DNA-binding protein n=1 Tax=Aeromonas sp. Ne-1 TaxID=1675689 RepID=A0A0H4J9K3_9GAMM|nr:hypothetical protein [Aeromonas sp. Ne-1]AKO69683.1 putative DNA-binding protein [Aeromonas sp. Ne-1]
MEIEKKYYSRDLARLFHTETSKIRRYSLLLEQVGYEIERDSKGWRLYTKKRYKST